VEQNTAEVEHKQERLKQLQERRIDRRQGQVEQLGHKKEDKEDWQILKVK